MSTINILTFQSKEVLDILLDKGTYLADDSKKREERNYKQDVEQLDGYQPIWCFSPVGIETRITKLKETDKFSQEDFVNGSLFDRFRCEMSLPSGEDINKFYLLELEIAEAIPKVGLTHNAYRGAVVIPKIEIDNLVAVYRIIYDNNDEQKWFYPDLKIVRLYKNNSIFKNNLSCHKTARITL